MYKTLKIMSTSSMAFYYNPSDIYIIDSQIALVEPLSVRKSTMNTRKYKNIVLIEDLQSN